MGGLSLMLLTGKKIGFALTGSFCTFEKTIPQISKLIEEGADVSEHRSCRYIR